MDIINKLAEHFLKFPGIGKRQASRFVYFLLGQSPTYLNELAKSITDLKKEIAVCKSCQRFFVGRETQADLCGTCGDTKRDAKTLMIVEKDIDLENIESSDSYKGYYFVLGGVIPVLNQSLDNNIRIKELLDRITELKPKEIILAMSANPEGENTAHFVSQELKILKKKQGFSVSMLGRGLSTGTELEYSDADTIKNALENRHTNP